MAVRDPQQSVASSRFVLPRKAPSFSIESGNVRAFTLIEIMVCICIVGVLAAIATPFYISYRERARVAVAVADMKTVEKVVMNFAAENGVLPESLAQVNLATMRDPWGRNYRYVPIAGAPKKVMGSTRKDHFMVPVNSDFDLYSVGRDGASTLAFTAKSSQDDIVRAFNGAYYGKVSDM